MSRSSYFFGGLLGTFAVSTYLMVLVPQAQLGGLQPSFTEEDGKFSDIYPVKNVAADQGRRIFVREGCVNCHTQQIRDAQNGTDIDRGWGARRTVARDYIFDSPPLLGTLRLGPDLTNVGSADWRNEAKDDTQKPAKRDAAWEYVHLYAPRTVVKDSNHPPYRYLFDDLPVTGQRSADALALDSDNAPTDGQQIVPTNDARSLVAYLLTLDRSHPLKEAGAPAAAPAAGATLAPGAAAPAPAPAATPAK